MADPIPEPAPTPDRSAPEWLGRLAHDLRNPITPMRSAVQLLQLGRLPPELAPDLLRTLDRQIDYLLRLIDDVADLVRIENGNFPWQPSACDLGALVGAAVERHARRGGKRPIVIDVDAPPAPVVVMADETRLRQLLDTMLGCLGDGDDPLASANVGVRQEGEEAVVRIVDGGRELGPNACLDFLATGEATSDASALSMSYLVARRIVELHAATVALVDGGAALELRLPVAAR
jgi:K+-sensing histidine kinase KdpD